MLRALDIAGMVCPNNVFLAPMAGYTNYPFRKMCEELGAGLTFTEMVSAKGLHYGNEETKMLLYHGEPTQPLAAEGTPPLASPLRGSTRAAGDRVSENPSVTRSIDVILRSVATEGSPERGAESNPSVAFGDSSPTGAPRGSSSAGQPSPLAAQIFGSDPDIMREACESEALAPFDLIDINMGCPMPKIVRNGDGSALMEDFPLAEKVISACVKSGKRISVKFRIGVDENHKCAAEFARLCEGAGACMVTVHGRTRDKIYAGPVDYDEIAAAKAAVGIPVIANGGIWNSKDVRKMFDRTGADGVMIARAALYRPTVFCSVREEEEPPILPLFLRQLEETKELYGERFAVVFMRKMGAFYARGRHGAAAFKRKFFTAETSEEVAALFQELWEEG